MRYFLFSAIIHLMFVVMGLFVLKDTFQFQKVGDPAVSFSMVGQSAEASGFSSQPLAKIPLVEETPKPKNKEVKEKKVEVEEVKKVQETPVEKPIEEVVIEEEIIEVPLEEVKEVVEEKELLEVVEDLEVQSPLELDNSDNNSDSSEEVSKENQTSKSESLDSSSNDENLGEGLVYLEDGSVAAKNQGIAGLEYGFINDPEPIYPDIARKMGFNEEVIIKVRFLIDYNGRVEDIKFYDNMKNYGFRNEVEKTLKNWRATPITVNDEPVKLYFYKSFKFEKL